MIDKSGMTKNAHLIFRPKATGKTRGQAGYFMRNVGSLKKFGFLKSNKAVRFDLDAIDLDNIKLLTTTNFNDLFQDTASSKSGVVGIVESRCQRVIDSLLTLDLVVLTEAAKAPSDLAVLSYLLCRPELALLPLSMDPLVAARLRGFEQKQDLLQSDGGSKTTAEVASLLQVSPQAITKRRKAGTLIAVELGTKGFHYPVWQLDLPGLDAVLKVMRDRDPWEKLGFFLNPNDALEGKRPLDALRRKQIQLELVVRAAKTYSEQGA